MAIVRTRAALLAGLLLVGACGGGGDEPTATVGADDAGAADLDGTDGTDGAPAGDRAADDGAPDDAAAEAGSEASGADPGEVAGGDGTAPDATGSTGSAPAGAGAEEGAVRVPGVPAAGVYVYDRTVAGDGGTETRRSEAIVERRSGDDGAGDIRISLENSQGQVDSLASVGPDGLLLRSSVIDSQVGPVECDWEPDWLFSGAWEVGATWAVDTRCEDDVNGLQVEATIQGTGRTDGPERITVAGREILTWVYRTEQANAATVSSVAVNGGQQTASTTTTWVDVETGMLVRMVSEERSTGEFGTGNATVTMELVSFRPA